MGIAQAGETQLFGIGKTRTVCVRNHYMRRAVDARPLRRQQAHGPRAKNHHHIAGFHLAQTHGMRRRRRRFNHRGLLKGNVFGHG